MYNRKIKNIAVVIPNFNGIDDLKSVFKSIALQSYKDYKVILVDNGSEDESVIYTKTSFPEHIIIPLEKNYGFSAAVNKGITYAIEILKSEIERLSPVYQTLITLYHNEELSYEEIAGITQLPEGTVKNYLFRARKSLKDSLLSKYTKNEL